MFFADGLGIAVGEDIAQYVDGISLFQGVLHFPVEQDYDCGLRNFQRNFYVLFYLAFRCPDLTVHPLLIPVEGGERTDVFLSHDPRRVFVHVSDDEESKIAGVADTVTVSLFDTVERQSVYVCVVEQLYARTVVGGNQ